MKFVFGLDKKKKRVKKIKNEINTNVFIYFIYKKSVILNTHLLAFSIKI